MAIYTKCEMESWRLIIIADAEALRVEPEYLWQVLQSEVSDVKLMRLYKKLKTQQLKAKGLDRFKGAALTREIMRRRELV